MPEITGNSLSQGQKTKGNMKTPKPRKGETVATKQSEVIGIWKSMGWLNWRLYAQSMDYTQNHRKLVLTGN